MLKAGRSRTLQGAIASVVLAAAGPVAAQPSWLPPEARPPAGDASSIDPDSSCADALLGPLAAPLRESGFDRPLAVCPSRSIGVRGRLLRGVERPVLDESSAVSATIELRLRPLADVEILFAGQVIDHRYADGSDGDGSETVYGPVVLGVTAGRAGPTLAGRQTRLAWGIRLDLPWTTSEGQADPSVAAVPQVAATVRLAPRFAAHARASALLGLAHPADDVETRRAASLSTDGSWAPWHPIAVGLGVEAQAGWHGRALDHLALRGGIRVRLGRRARAELAATVPLAGRERIDLGAELGVIVDL